MNGVHGAKGYVSVQQYHPVFVCLFVPGLAVSSII